MKLLHNELKLEAARILHTAITNAGAEASIEDIYQQFKPAPKVELGHLAYACFPFAKTLRKAPPLIAKEFADHIPENQLFEKVQVAGPYLNLTLSRAAFGKLVLSPILDGQYFEKPLTEETPRTMIEYSQPNTHKELHVGHMRNLALGDALIRLHRYAGYDIVAATFPGDVGTHVAKALWWLKHKNQEPAPETGKGAWLGKMYSAASIFLHPDSGNPAEEVETAKPILTEILKQLEAGEGEYYDLWRETRQWSFELMESVYKWAGVEFEAWYWESDVDAPSMEYARQNIAAGHFVESQGAYGMDLNEYNLGFAMAVKGDGTGLYLTKDVELARRKFEEYGIEKSVYVVDKRQEYHFKQVFKVLELLGFEQAKDCYHLKYDYVELPDGPMSSRQGNIVPIMALIDNMEATIRTNYLDAQVEKGDLSEAEASVIAEQVAKGAIKYGMLKIDTQKKIVFDMQEWIQINGNSGPYQQYVCARINSLLIKQGYDPNGEVQSERLVEDSENALLVKLGEFNEVALAATEKFQPHLLTNYLYDLSKTLNGFYNDISIRDTEDPVLKNTRMALLDAVRKTIGKGLELLGIPVPEKM